MIARSLAHEIEGHAYNIPFAYVENRQANVSVRCNSSGTFTLIHVIERNTLKGVRESLTVGLVKHTKSAASDSCIGLVVNFVKIRKPVCGTIWYH